jgi:hypothetical protein
MAIQFDVGELSSELAKLRSRPYLHKLASSGKILSDEDFWTLVSSWEHIAADRPRIAEIGTTGASGASSHPRAR